MNGDKRIGIVGAGSWGTALTHLLTEQDMDADLWAYEKEIVDQIEHDHENRTYLPGIPLSSRVHAGNDLEAVVSEKDVIFLVTPSHVYRSVVSRFRRFLDPRCIVVSAAKGVENETCDLMSQILQELLDTEIAGRACYLSGPSFAREVVNRLPTAVTIASLDSSACAQVQDMVSCSYFRAYTSDDVVGVELGGAVKNVIAIAAGACDGLGLGTNAQAALITRGLAEMSRLGLSMGASPLTFSGLAGMGDLVLTCTGSLSRNRTVGLQIGQGKSLEEIIKEMVMVAEGVKTSRAVYELARRQKVEMPICREVYRILYEGKNPADAVLELMTRDLKSELQGISGTP